MVIIGKLKKIKLHLRKRDKIPSFYLVHQLRTAFTTGFRFSYNKGYNKSCNKKGQCFFHFASLNSSSTKHKDEVKPPRSHSKVAQKLITTFTILPRLCQTLNLSSMFVSLSIEENPNSLLILLKINFTLVTISYYISHRGFTPGCVFPIA